MDAVHAAPPQENAANAMAPIADGDLFGTDTASPSAQIEAGSTELEVPAAEAEAMRADEAPEPMLPAAGRYGQREKPDDAEV